MGAQELDDLFATAREKSPEPSVALLARVLDDARAHQPAPMILPRAMPQAAPFWARMVAGFGGGKALAGLGTAALAGFWLGLAEPAPIMALTDVLWPEAPMETVEVIASFEDFLTEG